MVTIAASDIFRRFLVAQLRLPSAERTTTELSGALRTRPDVTPDTVRYAVEFLARCDVVKFAPENAPPGGNIVEEALGLVDRFSAPPIRMPIPPQTRAL